MKIAVAGKGGVGKTTVAGTMARIFARSGLKVLAIDADPAMNLAYSLGVNREALKGLLPISENSALIEERTGAPPGSMGAVFSLTPKVDDIAAKFGIRGPDGVILLLMGTVKSADSGCLCPANSLLRALMRHLLLERNEVVVMDMEAGVEHLGRGTARGVDFLLTVVEPSYQSIKMAFRIRELATQLRILSIYSIANKIHNKGEEMFIVEALNRQNTPILAFIPYDSNIAEADMNGSALIDYAHEAPSVKAIGSIATTLREAWINRKPSKALATI